MGFGEAVGMSWRCAWSGGGASEKSPDLVDGDRSHIVIAGNACASAQRLVGDMDVQREFRTQFAVVDAQRIIQPHGPVVIGQCRILREH